MDPHIAAIIKLQSLDNRILDVREEIAALPKHIAEIETALTSHQRKLESDHAAVAANQKERRKLEGEVQESEEKISRLKNQMLEARTNEQYRAFQHEIGFCEDAIRKAEDRILDLMGESEPLEENVQVAEGALAEEKKQVEREKEEARKRTDIDKAQLDTLLAERKEVTSSLNSRLLSTYESKRKKYRNSAVAEGTDGTCSACHITLRPQFVQDLRKGEEMMLCESCGRLLYYHASVDVTE